MINVLKSEVKKMEEVHKGHTYCEYNADLGMVLYHWNFLVLIGACAQAESKVIPYVLFTLNVWIPECGANEFSPLLKTI